MIASCRCCFFGPSKRYQNPNQEQFDARVSLTESHYGNKIVAGRPENGLCVCFLIEQRWVDGKPCNCYIQ